jgi:PPOX class probable F420-dependent enzyme
MPAKLTDNQIKLITGKNFGHAATLNADGSPQVTPVWIDWDGAHLVLNSEAKRVKPRNLKRDPRIAVSIADQENPYRYIQVRGRVVDMTTDGAFEHIDKLSLKYLGQEKYPYNLPDDQRVLIKIEPEAVTGWNV